MARKPTGGTVAVQKSYFTPFGEFTQDGGGLSEYLFTDQENDPESGLMYYGARYYDPWVGRFLSQDPDLVGPVGGMSFARITGDPRNFNAYTYALNAPTVYSDPTGQTAFDSQHPSTLFTLPQNVPRDRIAGGDSGGPGEDAGGGDGGGAPDATGGGGPGGGVGGGGGPGAAARGALGATPPAGTGAQPLKVAGCIGDCSSWEAALGVKTGEGPMLGGGAISLIKRSPALIREAGRAGKAAQKSINALENALAKGNLNPGIGTKSIGGGILEARARDGARVFFRVVNEQVQILGKATKANQQRVIDLVKKTFSK